MNVNEATTYYAVVDCDNCFVSCERVFRPDLRNKPVVVLSNNDGCVVARSNEAKRLGVKAGTPFFRLAEQFPGCDIAVFSSNYELYGDMTARVMSKVRQAAPEFYRYSIDEAFVVIRDGRDLKAWGEQLSQDIYRCVGMPVSIGIAPNKTLAKMASHFAKHYPGYRHCCLIDSDERRVKALKLFLIGDVWGIGRRYAARLQSLGIHTAWDFASQSKSWVSASFNVVATRTWRELVGEDCVPMEAPAKKQSICVSRSFPKLISDKEAVQRYVANYAARCAEKLRRQESVAAVVGVFLSTSRFREDLQQYANYEETHLLTPTDATITLVKTAEQTLEKMWREGLLYKKAGVVVSDVRNAVGVQTNLLDYDAERFAKMKRLDGVLDKINKRDGSETVVLGTQQFTKKTGDGRSIRFADAITHDHRSPGYTTRWSDIIELK